MMALTPDQIRQTAEGWKKKIGQGEVIAGRSTIGGGSLPEDSLPTFLLAMDVKSPDKFLKKLRLQKPPIIARTEKDRILLDPRTVLPEEGGELLAGLLNALHEKRELLT
jgi:L-seryl-tRNA(Ser) seleniumtransferase